MANKDKWLMSEDGFEYKNIRKNGHWEVFRWRHDVAIYSFCPFCGYIHCCDKETRNEDGSWSMPIYAPEKEFNYCPMCGEDMGILECNEVVTNADRIRNMSNEELAELLIQTETLEEVLYYAPDGDRFDCYESCLEHTLTWLNS